VILLSREHVAAARNLLILRYACVRKPYLLFHGISGFVAESWTCIVSSRLAASFIVNHSLQLRFTSFCNDQSQQKGIRTISVNTSSKNLQFQARILVSCIHLLTLIIFFSLKLLLTLSLPFHHRNYYHVENSTL
jgi:hypothetical protein